MTLVLISDIIIFSVNREENAMIEILKSSEVIPPVGVPILRKICEVMSDSEPGMIIRLRGINDGTGTVMDSRALRALGNNACTRLRQLDIRSRYVVVDDCVIIFHRGYFGADVFPAED